MSGYTQERLAALEEMIISGVLMSEYTDAAGQKKKLQFQSSDQMRRAADEARSHLGTGKSPFVTARPSKGL
jgi:hypothetical protein